MEIRKIGEMQFSLLSAGDVFSYSEGGYYLKCDDNDHAINLISGSLVHFDTDTEITYHEATLFIGGARI